MSGQERDVEALAEDLYRGADLNLPLADSLDIDCHDAARAVLASDWLAERDAAIRDEAKAEALPVVAHKGPRDTDRSMFLAAARNLERGYPLGGGNLTRAVVALIRREVDRAALRDGGDQ